MNTVIVYDSVFGNTERVARTIAARLEGLGSVEVIAASDKQNLPLDGAELVLVGGPTHRHGMSRSLHRFLDRIPRSGLKGIAAAAFDTRYRMPRILSGSAAVEISHVLRRKGARMVGRPQSFYIERDVPPHGEKRRHDREHLEPGEAERSTLWADHLAQRVAPAAA